MTFAQIAAGVYDREPCARTFEEDVALHLSNPSAIVLSSPSCFMLARPVCRFWRPEWVTDPRRFSLTCAPDCWHIYLAAGDLSAFFTFSHQPLPWVSFERGNRLRFHQYERIRRSCLKVAIGS